MQLHDNNLTSSSLLLDLVHLATAAVLGLVFSFIGFPGPYNLYLLVSILAAVLVCNYLAVVFALPHWPFFAGRLSLQSGSIAPWQHRLFWFLLAGWIVQLVVVLKLWTSLSSFTGALLGSIVTGGVVLFTVVFLVLLIRIFRRSRVKETSFINPDFHPLGEFDSAELTFGIERQESETHYPNFALPAFCFWQLVWFLILLLSSAAMPLGTAWLVVATVSYALAKVPLWLMANIRPGFKLVWSLLTGALVCFLLLHS